MPLGRAEADLANSLAAQPVALAKLLKRAIALPVPAEILGDDLVVARGRRARRSSQLLAKRELPEIADLPAEFRHPAATLGGIAGSTRLAVWLASSSRVSAPLSMPQHRPQPRIAEVDARSPGIARGQSPRVSPSSSVSHQAMAVSSEDSKSSRHLPPNAQAPAGHRRSTCRDFPAARRTPSRTRQLYVLFSRASSCNRIPLGGGGIADWPSARRWLLALTGDDHAAENSQLGVRQLLGRLFVQIAQL